MATRQHHAVGRRGAEREHGLRLVHHQVYACRSCHSAVRVVSANRLPGHCSACGNSAWTADGACANPEPCSGRRQMSARHHTGHCRRCGYSPWTLVGVGRARSAA